MSTPTFFLEQEITSFPCFWTIENLISTKISKIVISIKLSEINDIPKSLELTL